MVMGTEKVCSNSNPSLLLHNAVTPNCPLTAVLKSIFMFFQSILGNVKNHQQHHMEHV